MIDARLQKVEDLRKDRKIKIEAIANELGITQQTIYKWLKGDGVPSEYKIIAIDILLCSEKSDTICNIADCLDVEAIAKNPKLVQFISRNIGVNSVAIKECRLKRIHLIAISNFILDLIKIFNLEDLMK